MNIRFSGIRYIVGNCAKVNQRLGALDQKYRQEERLVAAKPESALACKSTTIIQDDLFRYVRTRDKKQIVYLTKKHAQEFLQHNYPHSALLNPDNDPEYVKKMFDFYHMKKGTGLKGTLRTLLGKMKIGQIKEERYPYINKVQAHEL